MSRKPSGNISTNLRGVSLTRRLDRRRYLLIWFVVSMSCGGVRSADPQTWILADGTPIGNLVPQSGTFALLLYDPDDCLTCESPVGGWSTWESTGKHRQIALILVRQPNSVQRQELLRQRQPAYQLLRHKPLSRTPIVMVFHNQRILDSASGRRLVGALYSRWVHRSGSDPPKTQ